jgi:hypothetical protein
MQDELLIFCLRSDSADAKASRMLQWRESDWDELLRQAVRHGISAHLFHNLKESGIADRIPAGIERQLREITMRNASRNVRLFHGLDKLLAALQGGGIPVIVMKGAYLAEVVYRSVALRSMWDVDLLVKEPDLDRTVTLLFESGFRLMDERTAKHLRKTPDRPYHVQPETKHFPDLIHPGWTVKLDVHVSLTHDSSVFPVDLEGVWRRAYKPENNRPDARVMSPVDALLYQCMHASYYHQFNFGLRSLCDVAEIMRRFQGELNWEEFRIRSAGWRADRCAWLTLRFARDLLNAPVPEGVLAALKPRADDAVARERALTRIFLGECGPRMYPDDLVRLLKARRPVEKAASLLKAVFPSRRIMSELYRVPTGSIRLVFHYPVRLKDLFVRWGSTTLRLALGLHDTASAAQSEYETVELKRWLTPPA